MSLLESAIETQQLQYLGYSNTPNLWFGDTVYGLNQFESKIIPNTPFTNTNKLPQQRLGKRVEQFVCQDLAKHPNMTVLAHNLQIQRNQQTIGELDTVLLVNNHPVHLEIVYKFYLYDDTIGSTPLDHWIGPNRKDSFVQKLDKLKYKQLPLLFHRDTQPYLKVLALKPEQIQQEVLFKAQLFLPKTLKKTTFKSINSDCIAGSYIKRDMLPSFQNCLFYIPSKLNWLIDIQSNVSWLSYSQFLESVSVFLDRQLAPLIWIKHPNGITERCFVVWW
jgi:hypothetical protein